MKQGSPILKLEGITKRWDGRPPVLDGVDLTVHRGDFLLITGPNGGGKTTLLRILLRLLRPDNGSVSYFGEDAKPVSSLSIGYLPQKSSIDTRFPIDVRSVVASALLSRHFGDRDARITRVLGSVGLLEHAARTLGDLSGGQVQRALLARAIVADPELLVLDEPLSYLDRHYQAAAVDLIADVARDTTVIVVSHELNAFADLASRRIYVDRTVSPLK